MVLGRSQGLCGRSWVALRAFAGGHGSVLGPMLAFWGRSWAYVDGLGPLLGALLAVLGRSWGLCKRSWERIRAQVGGLGVKVVDLGSDQGEKWPKPER